MFLASLMPTGELLQSLIAGLDPKRSDDILSVAGDGSVLLGAYAQRVVVADEPDRVVETARRVHIAQVAPSVYCQVPLHSPLAALVSSARARALGFAVSNHKQEYHEPPKDNVVVCQPKVRLNLCLEPQPLSQYIATEGICFDKVNIGDAPLQRWLSTKESSHTFYDRLSRSLSDDGLVYVTGMHAPFDSKLFEIHATQTDSARKSDYGVLHSFVYHKAPQHGIRRQYV